MKRTSRENNMENEDGIGEKEKDEKEGNKQVIEVLQNEDKMKG